MSRILTNGEISLGAYMFPNMKKPHIAFTTHSGHGIYDCGRFNSVESAERFMKALAELVGVQVDEEATK